MVDDKEFMPGGREVDQSGKMRPGLERYGVGQFINQSYRRVMDQFDPFLELNGLPHYIPYRVSSEDIRRLHSDPPYRTAFNAALGLVAEGDRSYKFHPRYILGINEGTDTRKARFFRVNPEAGGIRLLTVDGRGKMVDEQGREVMGHLNGADPFESAVPSRLRSSGIAVPSIRLDPKRIRKWNPFSASEQKYELSAGDPVDILFTTKSITGGRYGSFILCVSDIP